MPLWIMASFPLAEVQLLTPVEQQEIWAAGVTYLRSKKARMEESDFSASAYDRVYEAARPELFFKSVAHKVSGPGGPVGGVWGSAVEEDRMYVAVGGYRNQVTGGIHAIDIDTGERIWYTPPQPLLCSPPGPTCSSTQAAAVTAVPGAVFSGAADGGLRAYDARDGKVIWTFDANRESTINLSVSRAIARPG